MKKLNYVNDNPIRYFTSVILLCLASVAFSQNIVNGKVKDNTGEALIGASIIIQNTNIGTTTDLDGNFSIQASEGDVLECSYIGYKTMTAVVGSDNSLNFELSQEGIGLEQIIVSSRKVEESLQTVPLSVSAFSEKNLQSKGIQTITDVGNFSPNVQFENTSPISGSSSALVTFIRGIGQTDYTIASEAGVGLYIDGIYYARNVGGVVDLLDIARVEILKGPQGTLFGRNTIGGAINIVTKKPFNEFRVKGDITTGGYNQFNVRATVDIPLTDKLFSTISVSDKNQDGFVNRIPYLGENNGDIQILGFGKYSVLDPTSDLGNENNTTFRAKLAYYPSDKVRVTLSGDYSTVRENGAPNSLTEIFGHNDPASLVATYNASIAGLTPFTVDGQLIANPNTTPYDERFLTNDPFTQYGTAGTGTEIDGYGGSLTIDVDLSDQITFKSITSYRDLFSIFGEDADFSPLIIDHHLFDMEQDQFTQEFQLTGSNDKMNWVAGAYYFQEDGFLINNVPLGGGILQINGGGFVDTKSYAGFGQLNYNLTDKLSLTGGIRYTTDDKGFVGTERDNNLFYGQLEAIGAFPSEAFPDPNDKGQLYPLGNHSETFNSLDFRAGLEYQMNKDAMVYFSFAEGFKSGGFTTRLTGPVLDVPRFDPEEADTYELGIKTQFNNNFRINAAAFYTDYTNLQIVVQRGISPFLENAAEAEIRGIELDMNWAPVQNLTLNAGLGILDAKYTKVDPDAAITTENELVNAPATTLVVSGDFVTPLASGSKITWHADYNYKSTIYNNSENTESLIQPSVGMLNAAVTFGHKSNKWSLRLGVQNATNELIKTSGFFQPGIGYTLATYNRPRFANATLIFNL